ncbi:MAG: alpha/beta hydrolase, partial [Actinomycetota bacterium]
DSLHATGRGREIERASQAASRRELVPEGMPPYLLVHGTDDVNAPFEQSVLMFEAMRKVGARADLIAIDKGGHGMGSWDRVPEQASYREKMLGWIKQTFGVK